jgi:hypothetical protein
MSIDVSSWLRAVLDLPPSFLGWDLWIFQCLFIDNLWCIPLKSSALALSTAGIPEAHQMQKEWRHWKSKVLNPSSWWCCETWARKAIQYYLR